MDSINDSVHVPETAPTTRHRRVAFIYGSTTRRIERLKRAVIELPEPHRPEQWTWIAAESAAHVRRFALQAVDTGADLVVAIGGDGTVSSVAGALHQTNVPLGIVPAGTANLFARNLGIADRGPEAIRTALAGIPHRVDLGRLQFVRSDDSEQTCYFTVMCGFGVDSEMVRSATAARKASLGELAYVPAVIRGLFRNRRHVARYLSDGRSETTPVHSVFIGNVGTVSGRLRLLPEAHPTDGILDVLTVRRLSGAGRLRLARWLLPASLPFKRAKAGRASESDRDFFVYDRTAMLDLRFSEPVLVQADGDLVGEVTHLRATVSPASLLVSLPRCAR